MVDSRLFFERLNSAILASGKSRTAISKECGHAQPYISIIFKRGNIPAYEEICKLAKACGVEPSSLLGDTHQTQSVSSSKIPLLSMAQAGEFRTDYIYSDVEFIETPVPVKDGYIAVQVRGDSMSRAADKSIFDGCICIVDTHCDKNLQSLDHCVVVVSDQNGYTVIKELSVDFGGVYLKSWNSSYSPIKVENDKLRIIGKVITWFFNA